MGPVPGSEGPGPRGMDPLGPVPEYLILNHSWAEGVTQWLFYAICHIIGPYCEHILMLMILGQFILAFRLGHPISGPFCRADPLG